MTGRDEAPVDLTPREREVLRLALLGHTNNEIADALGITRNAVRYHLKEVHSKLGTGGQRSALWRGWSRGLGWLALPVARFGVPATLTGFAGGLALTGLAAYQAFPGRGTPETDATITNGRYPNGCPAEFHAGTMTLEDFVHGGTTLDEIQALNPGVPLGPLPPGTTVNVPFNPAQTCAELEPTPTPPAAKHILSVNPPDGGTIGQAATRSDRQATPGGLCAEVSFVGLPETGQWFRISVDGVDVTHDATWVLSSPSAATGRLCFESEAGLLPGPHRAEITASDPHGGPVLERLAWDFRVAR
jgi:DNA-binding CsgD family transcriptional regulator